MLESLTIRQIALIDEAHIVFHRGMQVLTGETGAGKSIVVDAVNLILGGRADRELIRSEADRASVEAVFQTGGNSQISSFMQREEIEYDGSELTVYREISSNGKNTCRINGVLMPLTKLKELAGWLIDLHGQSEHQFLADPDRHLAFLDQTGDNGHRQLMRKTADACARFLDNHRRYAHLVRQNENREERMASMEKDLAELRRIHVRPGEMKELTDKRRHLDEAAKRSIVLENIKNSLSGEGDGFSGLDKVRDALDMMKAAANTDEQMKELTERCESAYYELEEIAYQISVLAEKNASEPDELEKADRRLEQIHRLEHKHHVDADELPQLEKKLGEEYRKLSELENELSEMSAEHKRLLAEYRASARELTESRKKLAAGFTEKLLGELSELGMPDTLFEVEFKQNETGRPLMPSAAGDDRIEFLISPNPGEPMKPLAKTASGGELSRIMLAMKSLESADSGVDSMVFDEIDTGISGRMAQAVAEKMIAISRQRQVICVTHLPQIAAAADYHFLVKKEVAGNRTLTSVNELDSSGRIGEVGRMISGADGMTERSNEYASSLLSAASALKRTEGHLSSGN